jgi:TetR/AcrR family transcriptional regulator, transcriptional repressor for nem operon
MLFSEMTDSAVRRSSGKRERLIVAAMQVLYEQGAEATTLADIAQAAGIPVGNVYYYFKTKSDIIAAVIDAHEQDIRRMLSAIEAADADPRQRLKELFAALGGRADLIARYGCPHGSLCQELAKHADEADILDAARLVRLPIDWCERQFALLGYPDARNLAVQLIAAYQGSALLANALRDPALLAEESRRMAARIDSLE